MPCHPRIMGSVHHSLQNHDVRRKGAVEMRRLVEDDIGSILELTECEGWGYSYPEMERVLRISRLGCHLWDEGPDSGFVTGVHFGDTAVIGHLVVSKEARGRKVGRRLLQAALDDFDGAGMKSVVVFSTPSAEALYHSCGFVRSREVVSYGFTVEGSRSAAVCPRLQAEDLGEVSTIDRELFGDDRSALLEGLFSEYPGLCYKTVKGDRVTGYAFGRRSPMGGDLGPLVSTSTDPDDARALMDSVMHDFVGERLDMGLFNDVPLMRSFMYSHTSVKRIPVRMMVRGEDRYGAGRVGALGIAAFELG